MKTPGKIVCYDLELIGMAIILMPKVHHFTILTELK